MRSINPLYSFFNHSCEPNADAVPDADIEGSARVVYSTRNIRKGEEISISYCAFAGGESKEQRKYLISAWIGVENECGCAKCRREG